ncbi:hypothetical protein TWF281_000197 [Arthrobotrys megalospora]
MSKSLGNQILEEVEEQLTGLVYQVATTNRKRLPQLRDPAFCLEAKLRPQFKKHCLSCSVKWELRPKFKAFAWPYPPQPVSKTQLWPKLWDKNINTLLDVTATIGLSPKWASLEEGEQNRALIHATAHICAIIQHGAEKYSADEKSWKATQQAKVASGNMTKPVYPPYWYHHFIEGYDKTTKGSKTSSPYQEIFNFWFKEVPQGGEMGNGNVAVDYSFEETMIDSTEDTDTGESDGDVNGLAREAEGYIGEKTVLLNFEVGAKSSRPTGEVKTPPHGRAPGLFTLEDFDSTISSVIRKLDELRAGSRQYWNLKKA